MERGFDSLTTKGGETRERFLDGCREFDRGRMFEAHEAWEEIWMPRRDGETGVLLQGLIQVAAACHLGRRQRLKPALRLLRASETKLCGLPADSAGLDLSSLLTWIRWQTREIATGSGSEWFLPPRLLEAASAGRDEEGDLCR